MSDLKFSLDAEDTSLLAQYAIGASLSSEVRVVRNIYRNSENGYSIYDAEDTDYRLLKLSGYFPTPLRLDGYYKVRGIVKKGKYGRTLQVDDYKSALPEDQDSVITILRTLPGLDTRAPDVYRALGPQALGLIMDSPEIVAKKIPGVGVSTAIRWQQALKGFREDDVVLNTLQEYQIPASDASRLLEKYPDIIQRLKTSPYFLADEISGFGFLKCDKIALENGYPPDGLERLEQAMLHVLQQDCWRNGNCYMQSKLFSEQVSRLVDIELDYKSAMAIVRGETEPPLGIDKQALANALASRRVHAGHGFRFPVVKIPSSALKMALGTLRSSSRIIVEEDRVYLGYLHQAESMTARCLRTMAASEYGDFPDAEGVLEQVCTAEGITLEEKQREAVLRACAHRGGVLVLNGRAGCGKTFTLNIIIKVLRELYKRQGLSFEAQVMAPTGQAAQVAHKATGLPASTIHRALHIVIDKNMETDTMITCDCVVIDEFSMVGINLASILLSSIAGGTKTIIMGDFHQLPSIDPGNVLKDIIESGAIPVVTLNVVKRQGAGSGVLHNANAILDGNPIRSMKVNDKSVKDNAYIFKSDDPTAARNAIVSMVAAMRKRGYRLQDIQVLCPQKQTDVGVHALNYALQMAFNPQAEGKAEVFSQRVTIHDEDGELKTVSLMLREGDKVVNTANNYEMKIFTWQKGVGFTEDFSRKGIVNGEMGRVAKIMKVKDGKTVRQRVYVQVSSGQFVMYEDNWDDLTLAYAMTIHRAQGSQWPIVIAPIMSCNRSMLSRQILYTLYTRAQDSTVLYGTQGSIQYAINNTYSAKRNTWLQERLRSA